MKIKFKTNKKYRPKLMARRKELRKHGLDVREGEGHGYFMIFSKELGRRKTFLTAEKCYNFLRHHSIETVFSELH